MSERKAEAGPSAPLKYASLGMTRVDCGEMSGVVG
jgi:hypothetical protein